MQVTPTKALKGHSLKGFFSKKYNKLCNLFPQIAIRSLDLHNPIPLVANHSLNLHNLFFWIAIRSLDKHN